MTARDGHRVLVTGATGFVGRALLPRLLAAGYRVRAALRRPEAVLPAGVEAVTVADLGATPDWRPALEDVRFVVHLAARVHVMGKTGPEALALYHEINALGTHRLAQAARAAGVERVLLLSSVKAMGEGGPTPLTETTPPAPADAYGRSKLAAESLLREAAQDAMAWVVLRPPLVYGPGVGANFLRLLRLARSGLPLPLAAIDNRRSLVFVDNLADAITHCLTHPGAADRCFLIHDGQPLSLPELIRRLSHALGRPARLFPLPAMLLRLAGEEAYQRLCGSLVVDDTALRTATGWKPVATIDDGLAATAAWARQGDLAKG